MKLSAVQAIVLLASIARGAPVPRHMIVLDPGHSHAAAVFALPIPDFSSEIHVFAPPGPDVNAFIDGVSDFNHRARNPTHWTINPYIAPDFLPRLSKESPGNVVVLSGRNNEKIRSILASLQIKQNVLADKPWIIDRQDFPLLEDALNLADQRHLIAYDCMTERFNIAYRIQRELMRDPAIFGRALTGTASNPAVVLQNLHSLVKLKGGNVNLRPSWFFDVRQQGEGIADVGTHLVDLEIWTLFPDQELDYRRDVKILAARQSAISLTLPQFQRVTGEQTWPGFLHAALRNGNLQYNCNNTALFTLRGIYTTMSDRWEYESAGALNDTYLVLYRGTRSTIRVRQSKLENYLPEIDVIPNSARDGEAVQAALEQRLKALSAFFPRLALQSRGTGIRVSIPQEARERGGSTFSQLVARFLDYVRAPQTLPQWEKPNMLAKYYVTTEAAELARRTP